MITINKNDLSNVTLKLDPVVAQLDVSSKLSAGVGLGLISANLAGKADVGGSLTLGYCPDPCGSGVTDLTRVADDSDFYYKRSVGYSIFGDVQVTGE
jgi:hypothetical protein